MTLINISETFGLKNVYKSIKNLTISQTFEVNNIKK